MSAHVRYLLFAMASGETSQAYALAKYIGESLRFPVTLLLKKDVTRGFFADSKPSFPIYMAPTPELLAQYVEHEKPDVVVLCNSKSFRDEPSFWNAPKSLFPSCLVVTLDSNWLFLPTSTMYPFNRWADRYYVNIPRDVFQAGLFEHGGMFDIPQSILSRIEPIGCIPAYRPIETRERSVMRQAIGVDSHEKLIFCYVSGFGAGSRSWVFDNLIHAVDELQRSDVKMILFGDVTKIDIDVLKRKDVIIPPKTNMDAFYTALSASDLVFQHQGLATLEQAISARIPAIANVTRYPDDEYPDLHIGELQPFAKLGLCVLHNKTTPISKIASSIQTYLSDDAAIVTMRQKQEAHWSDGEKEMTSRIMRAHVARGYQKFHES